MATNTVNMVVFLFVIGVRVSCDCDTLYVRTHVTCRESVELCKMVHAHDAYGKDGKQCSSKQRVENAVCAGRRHSWNATEADAE